MTKPHGDMAQRTRETDTGAHCPRFCDLFDPVEAAQAMLDFFGPSAANATRRCADAAGADGRDDDYRFWVEIENYIQSIESARREAAAERRHN